MVRGHKRSRQAPTDHNNTHATDPSRRCSGDLQAWWQHTASPSTAERMPCPGGLQATSAVGCLAKSTHMNAAPCQVPAAMCICSVRGATRVTGCALLFGIAAANVAMHAGRGPAHWPCIQQTQQEPRNSTQLDHRLTPTTTDVPHDTTVHMHHITTVHMYHMQRSPILAVCTRWHHKPAHHVRPPFATSSTPGTLHAGSAHALGVIKNHVLVRGGFDEALLDMKHMV